MPTQKAFQARWVTRLGKQLRTAARLGRTPSSEQRILRQ